MEKLNFDEAIQRLQEIVKQLDNEGLSLDQSIALFEEGLKLSTYCNVQLKSYEHKIDQITSQYEAKGDGNDEA